MTILVCLDRDGTINKDENYFLGSSPNWKEKIEMLLGVIEGIKLLNEMPDLKIFIITNQSGVALKGERFDLLDEKRMYEVNEYIIEFLRKKGANIEKYFACPYVDNKYVEKSRKRGRQVNIDYVKDKHSDLKPNIGMIRKAAKSIGEKLEECKVYGIGDRFSDVQMILNANGTGILITSHKTRELGDEDKVKELQKIHGKRVYIAKDFLDAAKYIERDLKK